MSFTNYKTKRLRTKYSNILMRDFGIEMSDSATNVLVICNGGLCNGITHEMVCNTFEKFGGLENVIMVPRKSYSFIKFKSEANATEAFNNMNEGIIWEEIKGPVHLGFVSHLNPSLLTESYLFKHPPGLILIEDFVTEKEEEIILGLVGFDFEDGKVSELKHRKVKHFGYEFKYSINNVDLNEPIEKIPEELNFLWEKLRKYECGINFIPDQLTVNCYEPGQGIPPHVDTHSAFEDGILSLSLESTVVMNFKSAEESCNVVLPRRSLCIMLGESRYHFTHGITPRKSDVVLNSAGCLTVQNRQRRTSLTFRKTRKGDCNCKYQRLCDSYLKNFKYFGSIPLKKEVCNELEESYVHEVYEKIASHFSETRQKPWQNVLKFIQHFKPGSILIDIGCGNGKYFSGQSERYDIGCDSSNELLKICREKDIECFTCNCLSLPIRDGVADGCICIAVIHHLTTYERRKKAIKEIIRVLRKGGKALIYVWAKNQRKGMSKSSYLKQCTKKDREAESELPKCQVISLNNDQERLVLPIHVNRTNFNHNDLLVPWKLRESNSSTVPVHYRFYHVFEDNELEHMCQDFDSIVILNYYYDEGNWCIIFEKK